MMNPSNRLLSGLALFTMLSLFSVSSSCKTRPDRGSLTKLNAVPTESPDSPFEPFRPSTWIAYNWEQIQSNILRGKFDLFRVDFLDFARFSGNFRMAINKQDSGTWMRQETWRLSTDIGPGSVLIDSVSAITMPVSIRLLAGREFQYNRVYDSLSDAGRAKPVTFMDLPLNANRAKAMRPGDFASLPVRMGIALGLEASAAQKPFAVSGGTGMFWSGEFRVNFYRQDHSRIRVKIAPSVEKGVQVHANIGTRLDVFGYSPGKVVNYDRQAEKFFGLNFFSWIKSRVHAGEKYAFDYEFDLADPSAQIAFNAIVDKTVTLKRAFTATHFIRGEIDTDMVLADLTPAEYLNQVDAEYSPATRRVTRLFRGRNSYSGDSVHAHLGTKALETFGSKSLTANRLTMETANGSAFITAQIFSARHRQKSWLSWFRENQDFAAGALYTSSTDWSSNQLKDIIFEWNIAQSDLAENELTDLRQTYYAVLGAEFEKLKTNSALPVIGKAKKFSSMLRVILAPEFIGRIAVKKLENPDQFKLSLKNMASKILDRYRAGRSSLEFFSETANSLSNGVWRGLNAEFIEPAIQATLSTKQEEQANYIGELFRLMNKAPPGEILIPAFLIDLSRLLGSPVTTNLTEKAKGYPDYIGLKGVDVNAAFRDQITRALYSISHTGYEN